MTKRETAPPLQSWTEHLKDLGEQELTSLAGDYCWLIEKNRPEDQRDEFRKRREAILTECERRGLSQAAQVCRPAGSSGE